MSPVDSDSTVPGFNPFLVRASVYWVAWFPQAQVHEKLFQSLLSQGISLLLDGLTVEFPTIGARFQSLLSQGISLLAFSDAGIPVRRLRRFQSLLSQGISLLRPF